MIFRKFLLQTTTVQRTLQNVTSNRSLSPVSFQSPKFNFSRSWSSTLATANVKVCSSHSLARKLLPAFHASISNFSTQNLFRLTETSGSQLQPYLDVQSVIQNQELYQESINRRQLSRKKVAEVKALFDKAQECKEKKETVQRLRAENTDKYQELVKHEMNTAEKSPEILELKEKGRQLREEIREAENKFNEINDQLVDFILSLPNVLDKETPADSAKLLKEVTPTKTPVWVDPEYTAIETHCGPGLLAEFPVGQTAWLDIDLRGRAQSFLLNGGFVETGNAEYVKRLILQGAGIDHSQFLRIREPNIKKGLEHTTYLAGGASFPSFLALFAQSIIEDPKILPLRYFVIGRSYESQKSKPGYYQSHAVQVVVACRNEEEMEHEAMNLQNLMEQFYSEKVGFPFQTQIVPAPRLQMFEKKKLAFVMKGTDKSPSKMIGTLSTVGDYVSKRLLCCYFDDKKRSQFLHLVTARFFDITHFLRSSSPKLISHADILARMAPSPQVFRPEQNAETEDQPQQRS